MRHGMQGHVAEPRDPTQCLGDAEKAWTSGRGHASPRIRSGGATWQCERLASDGPMG